MWTVIIILEWLKGKHTIGPIYVIEYIMVL